MDNSDKNPFQAKQNNQDYIDRRLDSNLHFEQYKLNCPVGKLYLSKSHFLVVDLLIVLNQDVFSSIYWPDFGKHMQIICKITVFQFEIFIVFEVNQILHIA